MKNLFSKLFSKKQKTDICFKVSKYIPTSDEMDILENIILDSAKNTIPKYNDRLTYGDYQKTENQYTWRYNKNINKFFPLKYEYSGKKFQWHYEIVADESLIGKISIIDFSYFYIETSDWKCVIRYWACPPAILFETLEDRSKSPASRQFVSFSGNTDIFKNDMVTAKVTIA